MSAAQDSTRPLLEQLLEQQPQSVVHKKQPEQQLSGFDRFDRFATIFGFVNNVLSLPLAVIAVVSILLATTGGNSATVVFTNIHLNAWHALMLWFLLAYSCVAFIHSYWVKHYNNDNRGFSEFLRQDLFSTTGKPLLLLPLIACVVLFFWILVEITILAPVIILVWIFGGFFLVAMVGSYIDHESKTADVRKFTNDVENNWARWDKRVKLELSRNIIVSSSDFKDSIALWNIDAEGFNQVLVKYASLHASTVKYGTAWTYKSDGETINLSFSNSLVLTKNIRPGAVIVA